MLDLDDTLHGLCRVTVPALADALLVHLRDPVPGAEGTGRADGRGAHDGDRPTALRLCRAHFAEDRGGVRVSALRPGPGQAPGRGDRFPARPVRPGGALAGLLRRGRPLGPVTVGSQSAIPLLNLLKELYGAGSSARIPTGTSVLVLPLHGRRRAQLGVMVLVRWPGGPGFDEADALTAAHLATQAGLGVDTAIRYGQEAEIADELQRSMLPAGLPQPAGTQLAHRYLPAGLTAHVGGDWYDAIPLPGNRVALVVGDVMGHSLTSAAIMGQLRTSTQTLAGLDLPPHEVLYHLDEQAQRLGREHMATCVYAVYDPIAGRLVLAGAGHVSPVLVYPDGTVELLELPSGAPIGVGGVDFESVEVPAPPGSALLLYTDGLVESRTRDVGTGMELLRARLAAVARGGPPSPDLLCRAALGILAPGDREDDIALLAARFDGIPADDVACWLLAPQPGTAGRARRLARHALRRWGLAELEEVTELMVSEVVTNAVRFASRPLTLRLIRTDVLRCEVGDDSPQLPRMRRAAADEEQGAGSTW